MNKKVHKLLENKTICYKVGDLQDEDESNVDVGLENDIAPKGIEDTHDNTSIDVKATTKIIQDILFT